MPWAIGQWYLVMDKGQPWGVNAPTPTLTLQTRYPLTLGCGVGTVLSLGAYLGLVVLILDSYLSLCRLVLAY